MLWPSLLPYLLQDSKLATVLWPKAAQSQPGWMQHPGKESRSSPEQRVAENIGQDKLRTVPEKTTARSQHPLQGSSMTGYGGICLWSQHLRKWQWVIQTHEFEAKNQASQVLVDLICPLQPKQKSLPTIRCPSSVLSRTICIFTFVPLTEARTPSTFVQTLRTEPHNT